MNSWQFYGRYLLLAGHLNFVWLALSLLLMQSHLALRLCAKEFQYPDGNFRISVHGNGSASADFIKVRAADPFFVGLGIRIPHFENPRWNKEIGQLYGTLIFEIKGPVDSTFRALITPRWGEDWKNIWSAESPEYFGLEERSTENEYEFNGHEVLLTDINGNYIFELEGFYRLRARALLANGDEYVSDVKSITVVPTEERHQVLLENHRSSLMQIFSYGVVPGDFNPQRCKKLSQDLQPSLLQASMNCWEGVYHLQRASSPQEVTLALEQIHLAKLKLKEDSQTSLLKPILLEVLMRKQEFESLDKHLGTGYFRDFMPGRRLANELWKKSNHKYPTDWREKLEEQRLEKINDQPSE